MPEKYEAARVAGRGREPTEGAAEVVQWLLMAAIVGAVIAVAAYIINFKGHPLSGDPAEWGQFGDFFGGILNPLFGFLSVIALLLTLVLQSRELRLSRESLKVSQQELRLTREEQAKTAEALKAQNAAIQKQSFEQTFFAWLGTYSQLLEGIGVGHGKSEVGGRAALMIWWRSRLESYQLIQAVSKHYDSRLLDDVRASGISWVEAVRHLPAGQHGYVSKIAGEKWEELYKDPDCEYQLDSLFRNLYRLLLWVDSQRANSLSPAQKWFYVSIVRSQLSWVELVYLFYNGQTTRGAKFKGLVEKYALFDNLAFDSDPVITIVRSVSFSGNKYAQEAYESSLARKAMGLPESAEETLALAAIDGALPA